MENCLNPKNDKKSTWTTLELKGSYVADEMPQSWLQQNAAGIEYTLPVHGDSAATAEPIHSELVDVTKLAPGPVTPGMWKSPLVENLHAPDGDRAVSNRKRRKSLADKICNPKCRGRTTAAQT